eukprot:4854423-Prymnesium_polylepis.2
MRVRARRGGFLLTDSLLSRCARVCATCAASPVFSGRCSVGGSSQGECRRDSRGLRWCVCVRRREAAHSAWPTTPLDSTV